MADENQNRGGQGHDWQVAERDALDRELSAALAKYAAVEPRPGLEDRVLAHVRAERERIPIRSWWRWSFVSVAVAIAAVIIVTVTLVLRAGRPHAPAIANHSSAPVPIPAAERPAPRVASNDSTNTGHPRAPQRAGIRRASRREAVAVAPPRLDHFPSPQPLTEQELALAHYVSQFPQEATLIAQAQEEYEKEIQQAMKDARPETETNSSDQQER